MSLKVSRRRSVKNFAQSLKKHPAMVLAALAAAKVLFHAPEAHAGSFTWNGAVSTAWGTGGNWVGGAIPTNGSSLIFAGSANTAANNGMTAGSNYAGISFSNNASAFTLSGNSITLSGDIVNQSTNLQTVNLAMVLSGATRSFLSNTNGIGNLTLGGMISGTSAVRFNSINGGGTLGTNTITLGVANTFTGAVFVDAGILKDGERYRPGRRQFHRRHHHRRGGNAGCEWQPRFWHCPSHDHLRHRRGWTRRRSGE